MAQATQEKAIIPTSLIEQGRGQNLVYTTQDVHYLTRYAYVDPMAGCNEAFGMFQHVQVNQRGKFYIHDVNGDTLIVRPHKNCKTTPSGSIGTTARNYGDGCPVYIKMQQCYDAWMMDKCHSHVLSYGGQGVEPGNVDYTPQGNQIMDLHQREAIALAIRALQTTLFNGGSYDVNKIESQGLWASGVTAEKKKRFAETVNSCEGQRAQALRMSAEHPNMHVEDFIDLDKVDLRKGTYDGDIGEWLRCFVADKATSDLQYAFDTGTDPATNERNSVQVRVSMPFYRLFLDAWRQEKLSVATNGTCWSFQEVPGCGQVLFYENRIPIVQHHHACTWDRFVNYDTLRIEVDVSRNWHFGTSFRSHPDDPEQTTLAGEQIALMFQKDNNFNSDYTGKWTWLMYSLLFVGIVRPDMYLSGEVTINKAKS